MTYTVQRKQKSGLTMEQNPSYFLIRKEKRTLETKLLFSFLLEQIQPKEILVCGASLEILELTEFAFEEQKGIFKKVRDHIYRNLLERKLKKLSIMATEKFPPSVVEACLKEFLKKECAFRRSTKVLIADKGLVGLEELLLPYSSNLNYVELLVEEKEEYEYLAEELYEESGLTITFTVLERNQPWEAKEKALEVAEWKWQEEDEKEEYHPQIQGKYHIIIDLREDVFLGNENLAEGCIYFDGSSSKEKEGQIRRAGAGATYISPRIYLDRALKSTV